MASIRIADDRLRALLRIEGGEVLDLDDLRRLLLASGLHFGISREAVADARIPSSVMREVVVAQGQAPVAPPPAPIRLAEGLTALPAAVGAGMVVGWREHGRCQPGIGVDGQPIAVPPAPGLGPGLQWDASGAITTRWGGMLAGDVQGLRLDLQGGVRVREVDSPAIAIADDRGQAGLALAAGELVPSAALLAALAAAGVVHGVDVTAAALAGIPHPEPRRLVLARGDPPEHGGDDVAEERIDTHSPLAVDRHQHIDFHRMRWLQEVAAGCELVRLHRGSPARPGRGVDGSPLPARQGTAIDLARLAGAGTRVRSEGAPAILAAIAGAYARDPAGVVSVSCPLLIAGHLDHHSGDIETRLPVVVRGDVVAGFALLCAQATVEGGVEDARLLIDGDLEVKGGILPGRQRVVVHGRLSARHITGRPVRAAAVAVTASIIDSEVIVGSDLACEVLVSSVVIAGRTVACGVCGDAAEARTVIELGGEPFLAALAHEAEAERRRLVAMAADLGERLALLQHHLHEVLTHHGFDEAGPLAEEVHDGEERLATAQAGIAHADRIIARHLAHGAADPAAMRLVVRRRIHAGSEVVIAGRRCVVEATREGPSLFHLVDGELRWD